MPWRQIFRRPGAQGAGFFLSRRGGGRPAGCRVGGAKGKSQGGGGRIRRGPTQRGRTHPDQRPAPNPRRVVGTPGEGRGPRGTQKSLAGGLEGPSGGAMGMGTGVELYITPSLWTLRVFARGEHPLVMVICDLMKSGMGGSPQTGTQGATDLV